MAKPLEQGIVEIIQDCYKDHWKTYAIKEFFQDEFSLNIPYKTIWARRPDAWAKKIEYRQRPDVKSYAKKYRKEYGQRPNVKSKHRKRMREYSRRPEVRLKQKIRENLPSYMISLFDSSIMTAGDIRKRLEGEFNIELSKSLESLIEKAVTYLECDFNNNSPIIRIAERRYKLNINSPYAKYCGEPVED